jgi:membrane associated rhomboid family serine protease
MCAMLNCPSCSEKLRPHDQAGGRAWACGRCGGRALMLPVLRRLAPADKVASLWKGAMGARPGEGGGCPSCTRPMALVAVGEQDPPLWLDVCKPCQLAWFDGGELPRFAPERPAVAAPERALPQEARVMLATMQAKAQRERLEADLGQYDSPPGALQTAAGWFGLPGELDEQSLSIRPWVTWGLAAVMTVIGVFTAVDPGPTVQAFGLVPSEPGRFFGLTFLTSMFVHAGLFHLIGNLYFLLVFGDNVEDLLGHGRTLALFLVAALAGTLAHMALDPRPDIPVVGASGGISGILAVYALALPRAKLGFAIRIFFKVYWVRFSVWLAFALWCVLQVLGALAQLEGRSNVSAVAHLSGAALGAVAWLALRGREG